MNKQVHENALHENVVSIVPFAVINSTITLISRYLIKFKMLRISVRVVL